jgi:hypothetical protein
MNELTFISSVLFLVPAAYILHKFYHLNKGINQYTQNIQSLNGDRPELKPNLTLIHCQKCDTVEHPSDDLSEVVSNS